VYDIGLNYIVGSKWPQKAMPVEKWRELEKALSQDGYKVSWQQGINDIYAYMDWINSCRILVSNDSLGLHIAFALKKKVVGLFGPTDSKEIYLYGNSKVIRAPQKCKYMPCYKIACVSGQKCMEKLNIKDIMKAVNSFPG
jgi:heptosyltransferase II